METNYLPASLRLAQLLRKLRHPTKYSSSEYQKLVSEACKLLKYSKEDIDKCIQKICNQ